MDKNKIKFFEKGYLTFMFYAIFGWCYEVLLETVVYKWGFSNRGVLFGPYCPIYGFGALIFIFFYTTLLKNKIIVKNNILNTFIKIILTFLLCMLVSTTIELIASYILEFFTGHWLWETYVNYKYNFQGRIALSTSIRFGLGGLIFIYIIQPLLDKLFKRTNDKTLHIISIIIGFIFLCDMIYTFLLK